MVKYLLAISFLIVLCAFSDSDLCAQPSESEEQLKAEDLPDVIRVQIIDTTQIRLHPRARFNDSAKPQLIVALAQYAKERRWNLPPILTPSKVSTTQLLPPKNYLLRLTVYPSLPDSLFYQAIFAGHLDKTRGFLHLHRKQLGEERTKGRGDYNVDAVRGELTYQYREQSEIALDAALHLKDLNWLAAVPDYPTLNKDLRLLRSSLSWEQQVSQRTHITVNVNLEDFRLAHTKQGAQPELTDRGTDLRFNFDMAVPAPIQNPFHMGRGVDLNPIHLGAGVEFFSAKDERFTRDIWSTIFRVYIRDEFTFVKRFVLGMGTEGVSFRERDDLGDDKTRVQLNPYIAVTTRLQDHWVFRLQGQRTTRRSKLSELYFDTDYVSLHPFLRPEKTWDGQITLTHRQGKKLDANFSGFAKQIDDLVVMEKLPSEGEGSVVELAWMPQNRNASIYGGQFSITAYITDQLEARLQYTHEVHKPEAGEWIAYRPNDFIDLDFAYHFPGDFHLELGGEFRGVRHIDEMTDQTLESYFLLKPKVSKIIEDYVGVFVGGSFVIGTYTLLEGYELSQDNFDFGIELMF